MNAPIRRPDQTEILDGTNLMTRLVEVHHNGETIAEDAAFEALQAGRPAYWSTFGYSNQAALIVRLAANRYGLWAALDKVVDSSYQPSARSRGVLAAGMVPLNPAAVAERAAILDEVAA